MVVSIFFSTIPRKPLYNPNISPICESTYSLTSKCGSIRFILHKQALVLQEAGVQAGSLQALRKKLMHIGVFLGFIGVI